MFTFTYHSPTGTSKNLSYWSGGWDIEQVDAGKSSVDDYCQDEDQHQNYLKLMDNINQ